MVDSVGTGCSTFPYDEEEESKTFETNGRNIFNEGEPTNLNGQQVEQKRETISQHQISYIDRLTDLKNEANTVVFHVQEMIICVR